MKNALAPLLLAPLLAFAESPQVFLATPLEARPFLYEMATLTSPVSVRAVSMTTSCNLVIRFAGLQGGRNPRGGGPLMGQVESSDCGLGRRMKWSAVFTQAEDRGDSALFSSPMTVVVQYED